MTKSLIYLSETLLFRYLADFCYLHELGHEPSANLLSDSEFRKICFKRTFPTCLSDDFLHVFSAVFYLLQRRFLHVLTTFSTRFNFLHIIVTFSTCFNDVFYMFYRRFLHVLPTFSTYFSNVFYILKRRFLHVLSTFSTLSCFADVFYMF